MVGPTHPLTAAAAELRILNSVLIIIIMEDSFSDSLVRPLTIRQRDRVLACQIALISFLPSFLSFRGNNEIIA